MPSDTEMSEVYHRLANAEKELHTLRFRADQIDGQKLPDRVSAIEPAMAQMRRDVSKIEGNVEEIKEEIETGVNGLKEEMNSMKGTLKGFLLAISAAVAVIQLIPIIAEVFKWVR
jgi:septation ring formation regulator EzrA